MRSFIYTFTSLLNSLSGSFNKRSGVSNSKTCPAPSIRILSESIIVPILWAIVKVVIFLVVCIFRMLSCNFPSVIVSIDAVASSNIIIFAFCKNALATQNTKKK